MSGFREDDPNTWKKLSETETGRYYDAYGLPPDPVIFTKQLLRNRQNSNVVRALTAILGEGILVSHDRWCVYRPTQQGGVPTKNNLHLDLHPWRYLDGNTRIEDLRYEDGHDHEFPLRSHDPGPKMVLMSRGYSTCWTIRRKMVAHNWCQVFTISSQHGSRSSAMNRNGSSNLGSRPTGCILAMVVPASSSMSRTRSTPWRNEFH